MSRRPFVARSLVLAAAFAFPACVVQSNPPPGPPPPPPPGYGQPPPPGPPAPAQPPYAEPPEPADPPAPQPPGIANGVPPGMHAGAPEAYWVWHDPGGAIWHVRTTTAGRLHRFTGRVAVRGGALADVRPTRLEHNDRFRSGPRRIGFDFHTQGGVDGFDFRLDGEKCAHFHMAIDGNPHPGRIFIGSSGAHPSHAHFALCAP